MSLVKSICLLVVFVVILIPMSVNAELVIERRYGGMTGTAYVTVKVYDSKGNLLCSGNVEIDNREEARVIGPGGIAFGETQLPAGEHHVEVSSDEELLVGVYETGETTRLVSYTVSEVKPGAGPSGVVVEDKDGEPIKPVIVAVNGDMVFVDALIGIYDEDGNLVDESTSEIPPKGTLTVKSSSIPDNAGSVVVKDNTGQRLPAVAFYKDGNGNRAAYSQTPMELIENNSDGWDEGVHFPLYQGGAGNGVSVINPYDTERDGAYDFKNLITNEDEDSGFAGNKASCEISRFYQPTLEETLLMFDFYQYDSSTSPYNAVSGCGVYSGSASSTSSGSRSAARSSSSSGEFVVYPNLASGDMVSGIVPGTSNGDVQILYMRTTNAHASEEEYDLQLFASNGTEVYSDQYLMNESEALEINLNPLLADNGDHTVVLTAVNTSYDIYGLVVWGDSDGDKAVMPLTPGSNANGTVTYNVPYVIEGNQGTLPAVFSILMN